jgi:hypothetical protein
VMLVGVFGLLLSLLVLAPLSRRRNHSGGYRRGRAAGHHRSCPGWRTVRWRTH